jgi:hypothetical protein
MGRCAFSLSFATIDGFLVLTSLCCKCEVAEMGLFPQAENKQQLKIAKQIAYKLVMYFFRF